MIVLVIAIGAVYLMVFRKPYEVLFSRLRPADAATIVAELDKKKVRYHLADGGATILVPHNSVDSTRLNVLSQDLPLKGAVGFELFNKSDMGLTEFAQRINYQRALQGELARTLMTVDSVDSARVHLSIAEPTIFRDDRRPSKASVTLTARPGRVITLATVLGVQRLVAASVSELSAADVVVLDEQGRVVSGGVLDAAPAAPEPSRSAEVEAYYVSKIRDALAEVYSRDDFDIAVWAPRELDPVASPADTVGAGKRDYTLRVVLSAARPMSAQRLERARMIAEEVVEAEPARGDTVTLIPTGAAASASYAPPAAAPASSVRAAALDGRGVRFWLYGAFAALLLLGVLATFPRRRRSEGMSEAQRQSYADRIGKLMSTGEA
ncbi:MAG TPA: flagellar basal-body MS-ring/collar protein FliF [Caulobacteraceae bacterium]